MGELAQRLSIHSHSMRSIYPWLIESIGYVLKSSIQFCTLLALVLIVYASNNVVSGSYTLTLFLVPIIISLGCVTAAAGAHRVPVFAVFERISISAWARLLVLGFIPWILFALYSQLFNSTFLKACFAIFFNQSIYNTNVFHSFNIDFLMWFSICGTLFWFTVPLIVFRKLTLIAAMSEAGRAVAKNTCIIVINLLIITLLTVSLLLPILSLPLLAITSSMMFVSYSHVIYK